MFCRVFGSNAKENTVSEAHPRPAHREGEDTAKVIPFWRSAEQLVETFLTCGAERGRSNLLTAFFSRGEVRSVAVVPLPCPRRRPARWGGGAAVRRGGRHRGPARPRPPLPQRRRRLTAPAGKGRQGPRPSAGAASVLPTLVPSPGRRDGHPGRRPRPPTPLLPGGP